MFAPALARERVQIQISTATCVTSRTRLLHQCECLDLQQQLRANQRHYLNRRARRQPISAEKLVTHRPDRGQVRDVCEVVGQLDHISKSSSGRGQTAPNVLEDLPRLCRRVIRADYLAAFIQRDLARDCHQAPRAGYHMRVTPARRKALGIRYVPEPCLCRHDYIISRCANTRPRPYGPGRCGEAFTQAFGSEDLDAPNLMLAITGFLPGNHPRMKATINATAQRLTDGRGLVYRYLARDGLPGEEGTFLLCTFWLAQAQALAGEIEAATATFERAISAINDVGLLAEEVDSASGEMIGNFPQAFSHIGLINAAWAITQARQRSGST
jgi:hypothetical protein